MSMKPGQTTSPLGSPTTVVSASTGRLRPTCAIRSPSISTSKAPSRPLAGSTIRPPLSSRLIFDSTGQQIQHGHANRDTVGDLLQDHRVRTVGDLRRDLDTAIH